MVVSLTFTNYLSFKKGAVVSEQHYFGYCTQIHMQAVEYILDDQPIKFEQISESDTFGNLH